MAFINEYVSDVDIARNSLDALLAKFNERAWRRGRPPGFRHTWTIDRERNIVLMEIVNLPDVGSHGGPFVSNASVWLLRVSNTDHYIALKTGAGSSAELSDRPFCVVWEMIENAPSICRHDLHSGLSTILKDALTAYGHAGAYRQVDDTRVTFRF